MYDELKIRLMVYLFFMLNIDFNSKYKNSINIELTKWFTIIQIYGSILICKILELNRKNNQGGTMKTVKELSEEFNCSESYIYKHIRENMDLQKECIKEGRKKYLNEKGIELLKLKIIKCKKTNEMLMKNEGSKCEFIEVEEFIETNNERIKQSKENESQKNIVAVETIVDLNKNELYFLQNELLNKNLVIENMQVQLNKLLSIIDKKEDLQRKELEIIDKQITIQRDTEERLLNITEEMKLRLSVTKKERKSFFKKVFMR